MAGEADFTPDEWQVMRHALTCAGVVVSIAEGGGDDMISEMLAVTQMVRAAARNHPNQLVRELANMTHFQSGLRPGIERAAYEEQALAAMLAASKMIEAKAPADLPAFRGFLIELAEAAANAHREGGLAGLGGVRVTAAEASAIARVKKALGAV